MACKPQSIVFSYGGPNGLRQSPCTVPGTEKALSRGRSSRMEGRGPRGQLCPPPRGKVSEQVQALEVRLPWKPGPCRQSRPRSQEKYLALTMDSAHKGSKTLTQTVGRRAGQMFRVGRSPSPAERPALCPASLPGLPGPCPCPFVLKRVRPDWSLAARKRPGFVFLTA